MIVDKYTSERTLRKEILKTDLTIIGGGISGICAAIVAARKGVKVVLVQDRPVLGGNGSSEVRLWMLGATSHMGNNNRWAREGGVIDEIMVENTYRNPEGNPVIFDTVLLEKVVKETNITLLLNTSIYEVIKRTDHHIESVKGFCSQNSTMYQIHSPLFCDASGDGIVAYLAGASYRVGAESKDEFGEKFAPSATYGELLGHSLYFYTRDTGKPVKFVPPSYAMDVTEKIPRFRNFNAKEHGCKLWWLEYGGRLDTIHDTEQIKWELWKVAYGAWNYIKNSGNFPEAENLTLEWIGGIPGKRESRRFEGDYMLIQQDIVEQRIHQDAVSYGGWSIDLHPADGVYSDRNGCNQWHAKGIYQIPYRCFYSKQIENLFLAGRIISASHVAFGSSRVMATSAHGAQAVGMAAVLCLNENITPREVYTKGYIPQLQKELVRIGHYIPHINIEDQENLVNKATVSASSEFRMSNFSADGKLELLQESVAQMFPLNKGEKLALSLSVEAISETFLETELRISSKPFNHTPDTVLETKTISLIKGKQTVMLNFETDIPEKQYVFLILKKNTSVLLQYSQQRITGILTVFNTVNEAVSNHGKQVPVGDIGVDEFEFWCPKRRPEGYNIAFENLTPSYTFSVDNIKNRAVRPVEQPNAWVADLEDTEPTLLLQWNEPVKISHLSLFFDPDYDHPMETVQMGHPEARMPFCVEKYKIYDSRNTLIYEKKDNYQAVNQIVFPEIIQTDQLRIILKHPSEDIPAALFSVRCYS